MEDVIIYRVYVNNIGAMRRSSADHNRPLVVSCKSPPRRVMTGPRRGGHVLLGREPNYAAASVTTARLVAQAAG